MKTKLLIITLLILTISVFSVSATLSLSCDPAELDLGDGSRCTVTVTGASVQSISELSFNIVLSNNLALAPLASNLQDVPDGYTATPSDENSYVSLVTPQQLNPTRLLSFLVIGESEGEGAVTLDNIVFNDYNFDPIPVTSVVSDSIIVLGSGSDASCLNIPQNAITCGGAAPESDTQSTLVGSAAACSLSTPCQYYCGSNYQLRGGVCVLANQNTCGDGVQAGTEQCDDGNNVNGDGCSSTCQIENNNNPQDDNIIINGAVTDNQKERHRELLQNIYDVVSGGSPVISKLSQIARILKGFYFP